MSLCRNGTRTDATHFHGFFTDAVRAVESGHTDGAGHKVYNLPEWTLGFSTAIELYGTYRSAVGYVCKYVRKQEEKIGGRWFYSGRKAGEASCLIPRRRVARSARGRRV